MVLMPFQLKNHQLVPYTCRTFKNQLLNKQKNILLYFCLSFLNEDQIFFSSVELFSSLSQMNLLYIQQNYQYYHIFSQQMKLMTTLVNFWHRVVRKIKNNKIQSVFIVSALILVIRSFKNARPSPTFVEISKFLSMINSHEINFATITPNYVYFKDLVSNSYKSNHSLMPKQTLFKILKQIVLKYRQAQINFEYSSPVVFSLSKILLFSIVAFLSYMYFSSQTEDLVSKKPIKPIMFTDIIGLKQPKIALQEVIKFMRDPQKYEKIGARMRKGIILYGPSGTGKTTLAKACANQANVQFFPCNASEFCEIYVGVGPKKVRDLFQRAKLSAPSIIFIDQIDAIGNRKGRGNYESNSDTERNSTINQLLSQMDGFGSQDNVLVIGATNRLQMLDKSLLRPGRFDLKIQTPLPEEQDRLQILKYHLKSKSHDLDQEYLQKVAQSIAGWSGADIQNMANESVYLALRKNSDRITKEDINVCLKKLNPFPMY